MVSLDELRFKLDELSFKFDQQKAQHAAAIAEVKAETKSLRGRLRQAYESIAREREKPSIDSTFVRSIEWTIQDFSGTVRGKRRNEAMWSDEFVVMGVPMRLEFFPTGRENATQPGFCSLFLWCPPGVRVRYQLRVGNFRSAPDVDEYASKMGHGHSDFCYLGAEADPTTDSVVVGVDILDISVCEEGPEGLRLVNQGPEHFLQREMALLTNRDVDRVEWRIRNIMKRVREVPRGFPICSPPVSLAGVREVCLHLYPNGTEGKGDQDGYCGFYVWCPEGESLVMTLFVGEAKKGPIKTDFVGDAKGHPKFCRLVDQIPEGEEDLVVGLVAHKNPQIEKESKTTEMFL